jgi:hypothetical protein
MVQSSAADVDAYLDEVAPERQAALRAEQLKGHNMGKGCLRSRNPDKIDFDLVRSMLRMTAAIPGKAC